MRGPGPSLILLCNSPNVPALLNSARCNSARCYSVPLSCVTVQNTLRNKCVQIVKNCVSRLFVCRRVLLLSRKEKLQQRGTQKWQLFQSQWQLSQSFQFFMQWQNIRLKIAKLIKCGMKHFKEIGHKKGNLKGSFFIIAQHQNFNYYSYIIFQNTKSIPYIFHVLT